MKKLCIVLIATLAVFGCKVQLPIGKPFLGNYGEELTLNSDSSFIYTERTEAGLTGFAAGIYHTQSKIISLFAFQNNIKLLQFEMTAQPPEGSTAMLRLKAPERKGLQIEVSVNGASWQSFNAPISINETLHQIQLRAFLAPNTALGGSPTIDTLISEKVPVTPATRLQDYELSSTISTKDLFRFKLQGQLKQESNKIVSGTINSQPVTLRLK
ncbi:hypothetical protein MUY27_00050 [Mucilaginibacter sp. RS28]|uniref:Uncharacterized protein n=1 Tax=Mucilaginibacter straminoryzae TaxID=2932774 RepID=A0A9X1X135_9SPHI|nr:hypothetical protein [Mucilaginibacter straminoryzae]MCJ8208075.1 hypothetical protein [Mucilaginibacter straminoryzae]